MLEGKNLTKRYGSREVLSDVSLTMEPGMCLGLIGSNGSGKSTLISVLAQTVKSDGGQILVDGRSVVGNKRFLRHKLGYLPQQPALLGELKVKEQLKFWQRSRGMFKGLSGELNELLGLKELEDQRISYLSGGQQRRVSFGLALMGEPDYLLMDEAFAALDVNYQADIAGWLLNYCQKGKSVLWCTHDREELLALCPESIALDSGKLVAQGDTESVIGKMEGRFIW